MNFNVKKTLLASTALIAVASFAPSAAQAADLTLTGAAIWGTAGNGMVATPTAGDNVILGANTLTINGSEAGVTSIGAITSTTTGAVVINNAADAAVPITIGSITITGAGGITQAVTDVTTRNVTSIITGNVSTGGALTMTNVEPDGAATNTMTIGGSLSATGASAITGGDFAGASTTTLTVGGDSAFAGGMTVTGGANALALATLNLNGATNTGNIALANVRSILALGGSAAQNVAGNVTGSGLVNVTNASGVTFAGTVAGGTITVDNSAALGSSATFQNTVNVTTLTLGGGSAGANSVTFDGTTQFFTVTGTVDGSATAGEVNTVNVIGGRVITQASAWGGVNNNIDALNITGTGTVLNSDALATILGTTTIGSGAKLDVGANLFTGTGGIANSGTIQLTGTGGVTGAITGTGLLDVDANATITGAITQGTADISGGATLTSAGTSAYSVGSTNFSGAGGTLALAAANKTVTGNFTNTTDGQGAITIADGAVTTAFVGNLGASTDNSLASLTIAGGGANVATFAGNVFVDALVIDDADELRFIGTSAQTVSGTLDDGILTVGGVGTNSNVTFNSVLGGSTLTSSSIAAGSTGTFNANVTSAGTHTNTGTTVVGHTGSTGAVLSATDFTNTGSYVLNVLDSNGTLATADFGRLTDSNAGATIANSLLTIALTGNIGVGTAASVLTGIDVTAPGVLADNSFQYSFTAVDNGANVDILVARATAASLATGGNGGAAGVLDSLDASTNTQIAAIVDNLAAATTQAAFNEILEATAPSADSGAVTSIFETSVQSLDVNNTRLAAVRSDETGMTAGNMGQGVTVWAQGFGQLANQDARDGRDGYEADTYGVAVGLDTANALEQGLVGVALSYANTEVESENANRTQTDIDSYQVSLYGDYDLGDAVYFAGNLGYAYNNADQTRSNVGGIAGLTANSDFDSSQYIVNAEVGRDYAVGTATLTPNVNAQYQHINIDGYTETGAGGASLNVSDQDLDIFEVGIGAQMKWDVATDSGSRLVPALHVGYTYDVIGDDIETTSTFTGGGAAFTTQGADPAQSSLNAGASLSLFTQDNMELTGAYDFEYKEDYDAHSAFVRAGYKF